jgi:hypothetical protein
MTVERQNKDNSLEAVFTFGHKRFGNIDKYPPTDGVTIYPEETIKIIQVDGDQQWPEILARFIEFLGGVYGYSIAEKVALRDDAALFMPRDFVWNGPTFSDPEEDEECSSECVGCKGNCDKCGNEDWSINL